MTGYYLRGRQGASFAGSLQARPMHEIGLAPAQRAEQGGHGVEPVAPVAIDEEDQARLWTYDGDASLHGAAIATPGLDDDPGPGGGGTGGGPVAGGAIDHDDLINAVREQARHDIADRLLLIQARHDGRYGLEGARHGGHRLQRRPQLAQASDGLSERRAARKSA